MMPKSLAEETPGCTGPPAKSFKEEKEEGVTLPPIVPKKDSRGRAGEAAEFLKAEELLWASFAAKTLRNSGPAIDEDVPSETREEAEVGEDVMACGAELF